VQPNKLISGQSVALKLKDAVCPNLAETIRAIGPDLAVTGSIVFFSDGCERKDHFAIVEVAGIHAPLIVPVSALIPATGLTGGGSHDSVGEASKEAC
jgi:hypothetical protein